MYRVSYSVCRGVNRRTILYRVSEGRFFKTALDHEDGGRILFRNVCTHWAAVSDCDTAGQLC